MNHYTILPLKQLQKQASKSHAARKHLEVNLVFLELLERFLEGFRGEFGVS